jgi:hypothetical protein
MRFAIVRREEAFAVAADLSGRCAMIFRSRRFISEPSMQLRSRCWLLLRYFIPASFMLAAGGLSAQTPATLKAYKSEDAPVLVLDHVRVIDGTAGFTRETQHKTSTRSKRLSQMRCRSRLRTQVPCSLRAHAMLPCSRRCHCWLPSRVSAQDIAAFALPYFCVSPARLSDRNRTGNPRVALLITSVYKEQPGGCP